ncbi:T9SS type A sorting domain-containing protein, partial [bacterium]|nr:T9SS type A sorting domain-containing protein [bacterium]
INEQTKSNNSFKTCCIKIRHRIYESEYLGGNLGGNNFWDKQTTPANNDPVADANGPYTGTVGYAVTLDGSGSYDPDAGDSIVSYEWDLDGDGQYDDATGEKPSHTWNSPFSGTISLLVKDTHNAWDTDDAEVTIMDSEDEWDFGDAPTQAERPSLPHSYPTLLKDNGARHKIVPDGPWFGGTSMGQTGPPDAEPDGQPDEWAGCQGSGGDGGDEAGITNTGWWEAIPHDLGIEVGNPAGGVVQAWIDWNGDGIWAHPSEQVFAAPLLGGSHTIPVTAPPDAVEWPFARFRISSAGGLLPTGEAPDGEVEDYVLHVWECDFGDAPSNYPSASHELGGPWLGSTPPDADPGTQPIPPGLGDDNDADGDDEDGLQSINLVKTAGARSTWVIKVYSGPSNDARFGIWIDFNGDGDWDDPDELQASARICGNPANPWIWFYACCTFPLPNQAKVGTTYARLRVYNDCDAVLSPSGQGGPGEVEDHLVEIKADGPGVPPGGIVHGFKFNDLNGNGVWDGPFEPSGEPALPGWTIWLDTNQNGMEDAGDQYTQTNISGYFMFAGLATGQYTVGEVQQNGWTQTYPGGAGTQTVTVDPNAPSLSILFGNQETGPETGLGAVKWSQSPLFNPMSEDTTCYLGWRKSSIYSDSSGYYIADDWFCHDPRPVTCVRWWGSYAEWDSLFPPLEALQYFHIGIWTDIPKDSALDFSHPGELIQEWFANRIELHEAIDKIHHYPASMVKPLTCFRYTFYIPQEDWFYQEGDSTIYWLSIQAVYDTLMETHRWGWLTREHYFNDDAVRIMQPVGPHSGDIFETGEPVAEFWDLAFALGTDAYESSYDFGDAPDVGYGTTRARNGAHHLFNAGIHLGESIDTELNGQPHTEALGDDNDGGPDEDGITFLNALIPGEMAGIHVTTSTAGFLNAWVDFNGDGTWNHFNEQVITDHQFEAGTHLTEFPVPNDALNGYTFARFRFSTWKNVWVRGFAGDGEVEDYQILVGTSDVSQQANDIPDQYRLFQNYPNPFNPHTTIQFEIPFSGKQMVKVELHIYNMQGQLIRTLINEERSPGVYQVQWDGLDEVGNAVATGIYLYHISAGEFAAVKKLILVK